MKNKTFAFFAVAAILFCHIAYGQAKKPEASEFIRTDDGVKLYVKESGSGPVCIFVHGGPGAWSRSFEDLGGNNLETHLTMVYYDQRGSGRSQNAPDGDYSLDRMVRDIEQIRMKLGVEKVYIMSHSFGGILAVNYAKEYPQHVKGLILVNSTLNLLYSVGEQIKYMNELLGTDFTATSQDSLIQTFFKANSVFQERGLTYKRLSDNKQSVEKVDSVDSFNSSSFDFAQKALSIKDYVQDYTKITSQIKCPVLVITGKKDHAIGVDHYKSFKFPNQKIVRINGGHILYFENNKEFVDSIFSFVKKAED